MRQSRLMSLVEAIENVVDYGVPIPLQIIQFLPFGVAVRPTQNLAPRTGVHRVVSTIRSYLLRRPFEAVQ